MAKDAILRIYVYLVSLISAAIAQESEYCMADGREFSDSLYTL